MSNDLIDCRSALSFSYCSSYINVWNCMPQTKQKIFWYSFWKACLTWVTLRCIHASQVQLKRPRSPGGAPLSWIPHLFPSPATSPCIMCLPIPLCMQELHCPCSQFPSIYGKVHAGGTQWQHSWVTTAAVHTDQCCWWKFCAGGCEHRRWEDFRAGEG